MAGTAESPSSVGGGEAGELLGDGGVQLGAAVTVQIGPERRHAVDVMVTEHVDERASFGPSTMSGSSSNHPCICVNGCQSERKSLAFSSA